MSVLNRGHMQEMKKETSREKMGAGSWIVHLILKMCCNDLNKWMNM